MTARILANATTPKPAEIVRHRNRLAACNIAGLRAFNFRVGQRETALSGDTAQFLRNLLVTGTARINPWLTTSAAAPHIAHPSLPTVLRRSG